eukprot:5822682-Ditylum_brightwellii.AAC.1
MDKGTVKQTGTEVQNIKHVTDVAALERAYSGEVAVQQVAPKKINARILAQREVVDVAAAAAKAAAEKARLKVDEAAVKINAAELATDERTAAENAYTIQKEEVRIFGLKKNNRDAINSAKNEMEKAKRKAELAASEAKAAVEAARSMASEAVNRKTFAQKAKDDWLTMLKNEESDRI